jgi:DNA polymerase elongation subunit (family B)
LKNGGIVIEILYALLFDKFDYVFNDFIFYFNKYKEEGSAQKIFAKLIINSLYGRLGMRQPESASIFINRKNISQFKQKDIISEKILNDISLLEITINNKNKENLEIKKIKNNIALAAAITSKARIKLYQAQQEVIESGGNLLYSDTDSVFASYDFNALDLKFKNIK